VVLALAGLRATGKTGKKDVKMSGCPRQQLHPQRRRRITLRNVDGIEGAAGSGRGLTDQAPSRIILGLGRERCSLEGQRRNYSAGLNPANRLGG